MCVCVFVHFVDANEKIYPVPVMFYNYRVSNRLVNFDEDGEERTGAGDRVLHRRFFLVDNISAKPSSGEQTKILVYAKDITLRYIPIPTPSHHHHHPGNIRLSTMIVAVTLLPYYRHHLLRHHPHRHHHRHRHRHPHPLRPPPPHPITIPSSIPTPALHVE